MIAGGTGFADGVVVVVDGDGVVVDGDGVGPGPHEGVIFLPLLVNAVRLDPSVAIVVIWYVPDAFEAKTMSWPSGENFGWALRVLRFVI